MRILKFGGSSVADATRIRKVCRIIQRARDEDTVVVVVSALGGVTDELVGLIEAAGAGADPLDLTTGKLRARHHQTLDELVPGDASTHRIIDTRFDELDRLIRGIAYLGECPPSVSDRVLSTGERLSAPIIAAALRAAGTDAEVVDGAEIIRTDSGFGGAQVDQRATEDLTRRRLDPSSATVVPVVTGFMGADRLGSTTTLGRGGSDLSATVVGAALDANRVEIWTDVNGIFTAPPRVVSGARPQPCVSYDEATELARFGATVLFTKTIAPVRDRSIPLVVRNTFDPDGPSTWVDEGPEVPMGVRSLASVETATVLKVHPRDAAGSPAEGVATEARHCLIAALAAASGEWTLVTEESDADEVHARLVARGSTVERVDGASVVSIVGSRLLQQPWVAGRALEALGRRDIALGGVVSPSEHSVCVVVERADHDRALVILHEALMLSHLANRAADSIRKKLARKGEDHGQTSIQGSRTGRHGDRRAAARPPAA